MIKHFQTFLKKGIMIKTIKKSRMIIISILLIIVCGFVYCSTNFLRTKQTIEFQTMVRNIEISKNEIDYQSILDEFEDSKLETKGSQTTFVGYKSINLNELDGFDLVSDSDAEDTEVSVIHKEKIISSVYPNKDYFNMNNI